MPDRRLPRLIRPTTMQTVGRIRRYAASDMFSLKSEQQRQPADITPDTATIAPVSHKAFAGNACAA